MATVRRAKPEDVHAVVDALGRALADDPFVLWLMRPGAGEAGRRAYVQLMLERIAMRRGVADVAFDDGVVVGAALWAPPNTFELGLFETFALLPAIVRVVGVGRLGTVADVLGRVEADRPPGRRWLLTLIGTVPEGRKRGVGGALMNRGLRRCDADRAQVVLETTHAPNLQFYERFGFRVTTERALGPDGPSSWTLVRPPGAEF